MGLFDAHFWVHLILKNAIQVGVVLYYNNIDKRFGNSFRGNKLVAAGSVRFSPPNHFGSANSCLSESLGASLPVSFGIKWLLIACSRGVRSSPIFGVVLVR